MPTVVVMPSPCIISIRDKEDLMYTVIKMTHCEVAGNQSSLPHLSPGFLSPKTLDTSVIP